MDMLNKKLIIKTLKQDIELLLMTGLDNATLKSFKDKSDEFYVRKYKDGRDRKLYFKEISTGNITKIERSGLIFNKVKVELSEYHNSTPSRIKIVHSVCGCLEFENINCIGFRERCV